MKSILKLQKLIKEFYPYARKRLGFNKKINIKLVDDKKNASDVWGKTAEYDPISCKITLYITNRHPKDILRSLSHELVHFSQDCRGLLNNISTKEGYAQSNQYMRKLEKEAYEKGNLIFRDFEDQIKKKRKTLKTPIKITLEEHINKRNGILFEQLKPIQNIINEISEPNDDTDWKLVKKFKEQLLKGISKEDIIMSSILKHKLPREKFTKYINLAQELVFGQKEEKEHTDNEKVAENIALQHLYEDPNYYKKLANCGLTKK